MWWKLAGLVVVTAVCALAVIPIRTHAVAYDPTKEPSLARTSVIDILGSMYLTPRSAVMVLLILALAAFVAMKVLRGQW